MKLLIPLSSDNLTHEKIQSLLSLEKRETYKILVNGNHWKTNLLLGTAAKSSVPPMFTIYFQTHSQDFLQGVYKPLYTVSSGLGLLYKAILQEILPQPIRSILPLLFFWQISQKIVCYRKVFNFQKQIPETHAPARKADEYAFRYFLVKRREELAFVRTYYRPLLHYSRKPGRSCAPESAWHYSCSSLSKKTFCLEGRSEAPVYRWCM